MADSDTPVEAQPSIDDGVTRPLDPRYVTLQIQVGWIVAGVVAVLAAAGLAVTVMRQGASGGTIALAAAVAAFVALVTWWLVAWPPVAYRFASYRVDRDGLEFRSGVYFRSTTTVPRSRVQHTDVSQGPFERRLGLATLTVHTAGTANAEVALPGLSHDIALRIRDHLLPGNTADAV